MAAVLLFALPAAVWGIPGAIDANKRTIDLVIAPVVTKDADTSRQLELHGANSTHSQSVQAAVHTWMYPDRSTRPDVVDPIAKWIHLASVAAMLGFTLFSGWKRLTNSPSDQLLFLGSLCVLMMLATPISHLHYSMFVMPLVCGHWLRSPDRATAWKLGIWSAITLIPALPWAPFEWLRTAGFGTAATLALWFWGLNRMGRSAAEQPAEQPLRQAA